MQRGRGGRNDIFGFGDPFSAFGDFGRPGNLISSIFGGRDPFDDPFFTQPFGGLMAPGMLRPGGLMAPGMLRPGGLMAPGMLRPGGLMPPSMFGPSLLANQGNLYGETSNAVFFEQATTTNKSKGPVIKELSDDDAEEEANIEKNANPRKHSRSSKEPIVQDPEDVVVEEKKIRGLKNRNRIDQFNMIQPQSHSVTFQSSTVSYGGSNGAYYTASTTKRMGGDGVFVEESKEANTATGKATHRVSRGIREKGHSVTRKLNSDGKVDTTQLLHNLNEDELPVFEEAWEGNAKQNLPGWNPEINLLDGGNFRSGRSSRQEDRTRGWALPSTERPHDSARMRTQPQTKPFEPRGSMK